MTTTSMNSSITTLTLPCSYVTGEHFFPYPLVNAFNTVLSVYARQSQCLCRIQTLSKPVHKHPLFTTTCDRARFH